jgi:hypothetical protein
MIHFSAARSEFENPAVRAALDRDPPDLVGARAAAETERDIAALDRALELAARSDLPDEETDPVLSKPTSAAAGTEVPRCLRGTGRAPARRHRAGPRRCQPAGARARIRRFPASRARRPPGACEGLTRQVDDLPVLQGINVDLGRLAGGRMCLPSWVSTARRPRLTSNRRPTRCAIMPRVGVVLREATS